MPTEKKETKKAAKPASETKKKETAAPVKQKCTEYVCRTNTGKALPIREKPTTSAEQIGSIPYGEKCKVYSVNFNWAEVEYNGIKGYASAGYLVVK